jgi:hypothetical protein
MLARIRLIRYTCRNRLYIAAVYGFTYLPFYLLNGFRRAISLQWRERQAGLPRASRRQATLSLSLASIVSDRACVEYVGGVLHYLVEWCLTLDQRTITRWEAGERHRYPNAIYDVIPSHLGHLNTIEPNGMIKKITVIDLVE